MTDQLYKRFLLKRTGAIDEFEIGAINGSDNLTL
jgi:hypothetical protein